MRDTVLDQGETDAQNFGDFPLLAFLEEKEHRGGLNLRRQDAKGVLQVQAGVQGVQRAVRRFGQVGKGEFRLPTVMVPAQVPGNDIEIVGRFAVVLVSVQGGEEPGKGLLGEVLRVVDFLEVVVAVLQDAGVVFPNKAFDGLLPPPVSSGKAAGNLRPWESLLSGQSRKRFLHSITRGKGKRIAAGGKNVQKKGKQRKGNPLPHSCAEGGSLKQEGYPCPKLTIFQCPPLERATYHW